jgi:ribosome-associated protein
MKKDDVRAQVAIAVRACIEKKAEDISILRLDALASGFTDYFVICSAANPRQVQAIGDEVDEKLSKLGHEPSHVEGRNQAEWLLLDYVDFVVHIFSESARKFYDLERLWKTATRLQLADLEKPEPKKAAVAAKRTPAKKTTPKSAATKSHGRSPNPTLSQRTRKDGAPRKTTTSKRTRKGK